MAIPIVLQQVLNSKSAKFIFSEMILYNFDAFVLVNVEGTFVQ